MWIGNDTIVYLRQFDDMRRKKKGEDLQLIMSGTVGNTRTSLSKFPCHFPWARLSLMQSSFIGVYCGSSVCGADGFVR